MDGYIEVFFHLPIFHAHFSFFPSLYHANHGILDNTRGKPEIDPGDFIVVDGVQMRKVGDVGEGCILGISALLIDDGCIWQKAEGEDTVGGVPPFLVRAQSDRLNASFFTAEIFIRLFSSVESVLQGERFFHCTPYSFDLIITGF